jgi:hypothetical protein
MLSEFEAVVDDKQLGGKKPAIAAPTLSAEGYAAMIEGPNQLGMHKDSAGEVLSQQPSPTIR